MRFARHHWLAMAGGLAFLCFLVTGLPARVAARWVVPSAVQLTGVDGSLWNGAVAAVVAGPVRLGPLSWSLSATALLTGQLRADIQAQIGAGELRGRVGFATGGRFVCNQCLYEGPVASLHGLVPALQGLDGSLKTDIGVLEIRDQWPSRAVASIKVSGMPLRAPGSPPLPGMPTASFEISIAADPVPEDGLIEAMIQDDGGPVQVTGRLSIRPPGNYELSARAKARPDAPAPLVDALATLGARGPDGSAEIGMSGSF